MYQDNFSPELPCDAPGKCEGGRELNEVVLGSSLECHTMCVEEKECVWYTYDSDDSACILMDGCPDVFTDNCPSCVYGHTLCEGKDY